MSNHNLPSTTNELPLIAIVGPTASGKTSLAIKLAQQYGGEIICADSRTVYKGMDVGTAKPSLGEQSQVPHWGLDIVAPNQSFNVAEFQAYARQKVAEIRARGHIPFLVGGTGLYIDAVLYSYTFSEGVDARLDAQGLGRADYECKEDNATLAVELSGEPSVSETVAHSTTGEAGRSPLEVNSYVVGIATDKTTLKQRIAERTEHMFENGIVQEAIMLGEKYGWESAAMTGNAYPLVRLYHDKALDVQSTIDRITTLDRQLAKRQMTWFRRNPDIMWAQLAEASQYVERLLARG